MFVKPNPERPTILVRFPYPDRRLLPAEGAEVPDFSQYWLRILNEGDVILGTAEDVKTEKNRVEGEAEAEAEARRLPPAPREEAAPKEAPKEPAGADLIVHEPDTDGARAVPTEPETQGR